MLRSGQNLEKQLKGRWTVKLKTGPFPFNGKMGIGIVHVMRLVVFDTTFGICKRSIVICCSKKIGNGNRWLSRYSEWQSYYWTIMASELFYIFANLSDSLFSRIQRTWAEQFKTVLAWDIVTDRILPRCTFPHIITGISCKRQSSVLVPLLQIV